MLKAYGNGTSSFWYGVVEDIDDPEMLGRVRVRVFGIHSESKQDIPTSDLPWAYVIQHIRSASLSGIGESPTGMLRGTSVVGFFRDGPNMQEPIIMGSIGGVPQTRADTEMGHNDPSGQYPISKEGDHSGYGASLVLEPDTNRLARNDKIDKTIVKKKKDGVDKDVQKANGLMGGGNWTEKETQYNATYPKNHVRYSETGHVEEWDDTPGKERLHTYHRTGTFEEIHPDGTRVTKIVGDDYEIMHKDHMLHIKGNCNITVDGDSKIYTKGNVDMQTNGNFHHTCHGNYTVNCDKTIRMTAGGPSGGYGHRSSNSTLNMSPGGRIDLNKES
jgi:hypothetical protein